MEKVKAVCALFPILGMFLTVSRKDNHTLFGMAGGKVDEGETLEQALKREVLEETGLHVNITDDMPFVDDIGKYEVTCFKVVLADEEHVNIDAKETGLIKLSDREALISKEHSPFAEYNVKAFDHFYI